MQVEDLENLFINNEAYLRLSSLLNRFNPIKVMGMERMEIRHSAILAWLLNPSENHHLGDCVLRAFISEALKGQTATAISALDVLTADLSNAMVYREWRNIDILIAEPDLRWIFIIENKTDSAQHSDQLERYIDTTYENLNLLMEAMPADKPNELHPKVQGIYLTLNFEHPHNSHYVPVDHGVVKDVLSPIVADKQERLSRPVFNFINYYLEVLEEMTDNARSNNEMEKLAKKLYKENRRVIDFIVEHGSQTALDLALAEFGEGDNLEHRSRIRLGKTNLIVERLGKRYVSVIPEKWANSLGGHDRANPEHDNYLWTGCENWRLPFPAGIWFEIRETSRQSAYDLQVAAEVGPLRDGEQRRQLIHHLTASLNDSGVEKTGSKQWFRSGAEKDGAKYSRFYSAKEGVKEADNIPDIKTAITKVWDELEQIIDPVDTALRAFARK
jgi:hypothetical protein